MFHCLCLMLCSFSGFDKLRPEYFLPGADDTSSSVGGSTGTTYPTSHVHTRTKHELKSSEKMLLGCANMPDLWAKYGVFLFLSSVSAVSSLHQHNTTSTNSSV